MWSIREVTRRVMGLVMIGALSIPWRVLTGQAALIGLGRPELTRAHTVRATVPTICKLVEEVGPDGSMTIRVVSNDPRLRKVITRPDAKRGGSFAPDTALVTLASP